MTQEGECHSELLVNEAPVQENDGPTNRDKKYLSNCDIAMDLPDLKSLRGKESPIWLRLDSQRPDVR